MADSKSKTKVLHRIEDFKTPLCRLSYARDLFKARSREEGKPPRFTCTLIFPKTDRKFFEPLLVKLIKETPGWGEPALERFKNRLIHNPLLLGDGKEARSKKTGELHAGMGPEIVFIRPGASEDRPPRVWWKDPNKQESEETVYSGCFGKGIVNMYSFTHPDSGDGITFGISGFQKLQDGERLGGSGGIDPEKWSETIVDEGSAPAETKTGAGAGALFGE